ncbi:MAG: peptidoglycan-binding protein [Candidatus Omnitrophica bacterium]|nr:peptidoglycan-binding protein [Candidatus Omnitrophota bacterium]
MTRRVRMMGLWGAGLLLAGCATINPQEHDQLRAQVGGLQSSVAALTSQVEELRARQQALEGQAWDRGIRPLPARPSADAPGHRVLTAREIQQALQRAGFYEGPMDGKIGPNTRVAIKAFQSAHHLTADGVAGTQTMRALQPYVTAPAPPRGLLEELP